MAAAKYPHHAAEESKACEQEQAPVAEHDGYYLFTTTTCPNCKIAKEYMNGKIEYELINADENPALAEKYSIMQAPTLVAVKDGKAEKIVNVSNIRKFVDENQVTA